MRFCVNGRQPYPILRKADEIKVAYADRDRIIDFMEAIPEKTIILDVPGDESDWNLWEKYNETFAEFYIALHDLNRAGEFNNAGIRWYWPYPITSYYELGMITNLHPSYLMIGPPLSFDLNKVPTLAYDDNDRESGPIPLRMSVNCSHPSYLPDNGTHGICGQWVRPEDTELYATKIRCFEFAEVDLKEEEVLFHVYHDNGEWPGNLNLLFKRLNWHIDNRALPEEIGERRMICGQRCWAGSPCKLCINSFLFAKALRKEAAARRQELTVDNN
jgi:hypothetical protein